MIRKTGEGILYPEHPLNLIKEDPKERKDLTGLLIKTVPHKSWDLCKEELDSVFSISFTVQSRTFILPRTYSFRTPYYRFEIILLCLHL